MKKVKKIFGFRTSRSLIRHIFGHFRLIWAMGSAKVNDSNDLRKERSDNVRGLM